MSKTEPKLTHMQEKRLRQIAAYVPTQEWPLAAYWNSRTDQSLISRGLIERCDVERAAFGSVTMRVNLCRLTKAGRAAIAAREADPS